MGLWNWLTGKLRATREHAPTSETMLTHEPHDRAAQGPASAPPEFAVVLTRLLPRLDHPAPALTGIASEVRSWLAAWRSSERNLRTIADQLAQAGDPQVGQAWLMLAQTIRYQSGRRDDTLAAYIEALYYDRANALLWQELMDYASFAPHVPTLAEVFSRVPLEVRPELWGDFVSAFNGYSRAGVADLQKAEELQAVLLQIAERQNDGATVAHFYGAQATKAEKAGDTDAAVVAWRRAVATGRAEAPVVDRFTIWLVKQGEFAEAAQALRQVLADPPPSKTLRDRLEKRLARCEKATSGEVRHSG